MQWLLLGIIKKHFIILSKIHAACKVFVHNSTPLSPSLLLNTHSNWTNKHKLSCLLRIYCATLLLYLRTLLMTKIDISKINYWERTKSNKRDAQHCKNTSAIKDHWIVDKAKPRAQLVHWLYALHYAKKLFILLWNACIREKKYLSENTLQGQLILTTLYCSNNMAIDTRVTIPATWKAGKKIERTSS